MKKFLTIAACAAVCASMLSACSDDDDDDDIYTADFSSIAKISNLGLSSVSSFTGINGYLLSDRKGWTDVACYTKYSVSEDQALPFTPTSDFVDKFYGGICPISSSSTSYEYYLPITGSFHSGSSGLLCNPGSMVKALFSRRHFAVDMSSVLSQFILDDAIGIYVCPTKAYEYLETSDGLQTLGITQSVKNCRIQFCVYGFINHISTGSWSEIVEICKNTASNVVSGGTICSDVITLAQSDDNGTWTVNKNWQYMSLSSIEDYYFFQCVLRVVNSNGQEISNFKLQDAIEGYNGLNYCVLDDFSCEGGNDFLENF